MLYGKDCGYRMPRKNLDYTLFIIFLNRMTLNLYNMGKARVDKHGHTREQRLLHENQQLKRQISALRKQIARLDLDRYSTIKDLIEEGYQGEKADEGKQILDNLKKIWACHCCIDGFLEIFIFNRAGETHYYRICSNAPLCLNRTKSQPYSSTQVSGIIRKDRGNQD
jgi:hypothetical protein